MSYVRRVYYTLIEIYEQTSVVVNHEVISLVPTPITPPPAVNPSRQREQIDRPSIQQSEDKAATRLVAPHFRPVDLIPAQLSRSTDWYREYRWR